MDGNRLKKALSFCDLCLKGLHGLKAAFVICSSSHGFPPKIDTSRVVYISIGDGQLDSSRLRDTKASHKVSPWSSYGCIVRINLVYRTESSYILLEWDGKTSSMICRQVYLWEESQYMYSEHSDFGGER